MRLTPMRYKDYTWPHNPETFTMELRRRVAAHSVPFGSSVMQELGAAYRVYQGVGVFAGDGAYEEFLKLEEVFRQEGAGLMAHPVWGIDRVWFVMLTVAEEPRPDFVRYRFEFWEDCGETAALTPVKTTTPVQTYTKPSASAVTVTHTVRKGDTLWAIARTYSVKLADLIAANPKIKNPNLIYPGNEVRIP